MKIASFRLWMIAVAAVAVDGVGCTGRSGDGAPELKPLVLTSFSPVVREQVQRAYDAAQKKPRSAVANGDLGKVLQAYEQYESAEVAYRRAHRVEPDSFDWLYYIGIVQSKQANDGQAAQTFRSALRLRPDDEHARLRLADCLLSLGRLQESGDEYRQVLHRNPQQARAYYGLGRVLDAGGKTQAALESYSKACTLFADYAEANYAIAMCYHKLGQEEKAREHLSLYQRHGTDTPPSDDPFMAAVNALNLSPTEAASRAAQRARSGLRQAIEVHENVLRQEPANNSALVNLVTLYTYAREFDKAWKAYEAALAISPNQAQLHSSYGLLQMELHKDGEARKAFQRALRVDPQFVPAYENLGALAERRGQNEEAIVFYRRASTIEPSYRPVHLRLGRLLLELKRYPEAQEEFLRLITPASDQVEMLTEIARCYSKAGSVEATSQFARKAHSVAVASAQKDVALTVSMIFGGGVAR